MYDIAVVGCGIVGAAAAFALSRYDVSVVVLEKENDVAAGATKANSAVVHAGYDPKPGTLMARLNVRGNQLTWDLCEALDVPHLRCGSLMLAFSDQEVAVLEEYKGRGETNGVPGLEMISRARLRGMEPETSMDAAAALYAPTAGVACPWELTLAMAECAVGNGAELRLETAVTGIDRIPGGYRLLTENGLVEAGRVLNAAGVHSAAVHDMIAAPAFRIVPVRGEYYLLDKSEGSRVSRVVFHCPTSRGKGTLVAPTFHGNLIVGPNVGQPRTPDDTATTAEGLDEVAREARRLVPSIDLRAVIRSFAGIRAAADADDFIIAEAPGAPGFFDLAGIKSPGLTAAPAIAEAAVEMLVRSGLALKQKPRFIGERKRLRFTELTPREKADLVRSEPAFGRVVCRCETVTEGEIMAALDAPIPPRSVDGVKRRTGAGMGRCQGGFCGPRVTELLSEAMGVPAWRIPQDLRGSYQLIRRNG